MMEWLKNTLVSKYASTILNVYEIGYLLFFIVSKTRLFDLAFKNYDMVIIVLSIISYILIISAKILDGDSKKIGNGNIIAMAAVTSMILYLSFINK